MAVEIHHEKPYLLQAIDVLKVLPESGRKFLLLSRQLAYFFAENFALASHLHFLIQKIIPNSGDFHLQVF